MKYSMLFFCMALAIPMCGMDPKKIPSTSPVHSPILDRVRRQSGAKPTEIPVDQLSRFSPNNSRTRISSSGNYKVHHTTQSSVRNEKKNT